MDEAISSMSHSRHLLPSWPLQALSPTGGDEGKSAKLTVRGEEVVREAECSVTCGRPWGEADDRRVGSPPKLWNVTHPAKVVCPSCDERC